MTDVTDQQKSILLAACQGNWQLSPDGRIDVFESVKFPAPPPMEDLGGLEFGYVHGNFDVTGHCLRDMQGFPQVIAGNLLISHNLIESLEGAPLAINGSIHAYGNVLTNGIIKLLLKGMMENKRAFPIQLAIEWDTFITSEKIILEKYLPEDYRGIAKIANLGLL
jgi:hypothetical protein